MNLEIRLWKPEAQKRTLLQLFRIPLSSKDVFQQQPENTPALFHGFSGKDVGSLVHSAIAPPSSNAFSKTQLSTEASPLSCRFKSTGRRRTVGRNPPQSNKTQCTPVLFPRQPPSLCRLSLAPISTHPAPQTRRLFVTLLWDQKNKEGCSWTCCVNLRGGQELTTKRGWGEINLGIRTCKTGSRT